MIQPITQVMAGYYVSNLANMRILAGRYPHLRSYKLALKEAAHFLLNCCSTFKDLQQYYDIVTVGYYLWHREHNRGKDDLEAWSVWVKTWQMDVAKRMVDELEYQLENQ